MNITFPLLKASDIDCRVATVKENSGCSLLLYKDARVDMRMLDDVIGCMNWKRKHTTIDGRLYCTISIYDAEKKEWIDKEDVGTESYTEKEKGQASDSFKRAGFNWGIGRELYTAPFIWVPGGNKYTRAKVKSIGYDEERNINQLTIVDDKGNVIYNYPRVSATQNTAPAPASTAPTPSGLSEADIIKYIDTTDFKSINELAQYWKYLQSKNLITETIKNKFSQKRQEKGWN